MCCIIVLAASSCTKQEVISPTTTNRTIFFTIKGGSAGWQSNTDANGSVSYTSALAGGQLPEIDAAFQANGAVLVYISFDNGTTYEAVPEVYGGTAYSYTHSVGNVTIYAQSPNGSSAVLPASDALIKIVLVDSNSSK